jgi:conjugative relaxase-like TrwC/TraI family protein
MIRVTQFHDRSQGRSASRYFFEDAKQGKAKAMTAADYLAVGVGQYGGKLAGHLGLEGVQADKDNFKALEHNEHPLTGERLTARTNTTRQQDRWNGEEIEKETVANRRTGTDFCFIVPKTLSVAMAENPGAFRKACLKAIDESWRDTITQMESTAKARVRKGGVEEDRQTGNLIYVPVFHEDARPVGSNVPDPYAHLHTFTFNATYDPVEQRVKAVQMHDLVRHADDFDGFFMARLEQRLTALGIGTERTLDAKGRQGFELSSVSKEARELFAKRGAHIAEQVEKQEKELERSTHAIVRAAAKLGKRLDYDAVYAKQKERIGAMTRQEKLKALGPEAKLAALRDQMTPEIRASLQAEAVMSAPRRNWQTVEDAKKEVLQAAFKHQSTAHELKVSAEVLRRCGGEALGSVQGFVRGPEFVQLDGEGTVTTRFVQAEESRMRLVARQGWGQHEALGRGAAWEIQDERVQESPDQAAAVRFLAESKDLVMNVSGIAGAGKSTMLKEVVSHLGARGLQAFVLAPTSPATDNLRGDGFRHVDTLQGFQLNRLAQEAAQGQVLIVDESSLVSVPQMRWVLDHAARHGCRVILAGDSEQHHSVERGDAVRILEASYSVRSVELSANYRAKPAYLKAAVTDLWEGRKEEGWQKLDEHGDIREVANLSEMRGQGVAAHLEAVRAGKTSILACPIHAEAREVTKVVRATEKGEGLIAQEDHTVTRIKKLPLEGLELKDPVHYQPGRVVTFHNRVMGGFRPGEKWQVAKAVEGGAVTLERGGVAKAFDPSLKGKWDLYECSEMDLSVGDQVRVTEKFKENGTAFNNNDLARVSAIDSDRITLADGRVMERAFARIDQGVCVTSYATECRTVDQIVPLLPMRAFAQVNDETWYVLVSRAREKVVAFTDCKEALHEQVMLDGDRKSVWEHERSGARQRQGLEAVPVEAVPEQAGQADLQEHAVRSVPEPSLGLDPARYTPAERTQNIPNFIPADPARQANAELERVAGREQEPEPAAEELSAAQPVRSAYERDQWARAAAKYPVAERSPELQAKIERAVERRVRERQAELEASQGVRPSAKGQGRSMTIGL